MKNKFSSAKEAYYKNIKNVLTKINSELENKKNRFNETHESETVDEDQVNKNTINLIHNLDNLSISSKNANNFQDNIIFLNSDAISNENFNDNTFNKTSLCFC